MRITDEMYAEDDKRWHARDIVTELGYCSHNMRDRRDITNLDIRFYAYIMRKAHEMLKEQEPIAPMKVNRYMETDGNGNWFLSETYDCGNCGGELHGKANYCHLCGKAVKWDD